MKKRRLLSALLIVCMLLTLFPATAQAIEPIAAGSYEELMTALGTVGDGGIITLTASITGEPININGYAKTFSIDKTANNYSYPALTGSYTENTNYYYVTGYGMPGVTLTHKSTYIGKVYTYTYTPVADANIAAYVSRETISSGSTVYVCTDMAKALACISSPNYTYLHLAGNFTEPVSTTKTAAFTLIPEGFEATGLISYSGTSLYEVIMTPIEGTDNISVSFKYISITVENGGTTKNFGTAEISEAFAYANSLEGATAITMIGSSSIKEATSLDSNVLLTITSGKTLSLYAPLSVNGSFLNNGTVAFQNGGKLTILTAVPVGTFTKPNTNYENTTSVNGNYTTYGISAEANGEVSLQRGEAAEVLYYGTLAEAVSATTADVVDIIKLRKNIVAAGGQNIGTNVDIVDLNGYTLSTAAGSYLNAASGDVTFRDSSVAKTGKVTGGSSTSGLFNMAYNGNITFESGIFEDTGGLAAVCAKGRSPSGTVITVHKDATVTSSGYGILIDKAGSNVSYSDTAVRVYGTVHADNAGIYINGNVTAAPTPVINIYEGSDVSGIYAAGYGTWNISGGSIYNETGIYIKSGVMNITGGTISGTGAYADASYNGSGANDTGDALVIDSCGYPGGAPSVTISGGTFASVNAYALRHVMTLGTTPAQRLLVYGGSFTGAIGNAVYSDGITGFICGGMYDSAPDEALIASGYKYNSSTKYVTAANAVASINEVAYPSLALAVKAAKYGDTIDLLSDNTETLAVSKVIIIELNGFTIGDVSAGADYVAENTGTVLTFSLAPTATTVVSETVDTGIDDEILPEDAERIAEVINLTQVSGVAEALSEDGRSNIIASAGAAPGAGDQVVVEISVEVTAVESDLDAGTLTFTAAPAATVYLNSAAQNDTPISVPNSYLNGNAIEVLLPLPTGFTPKEIIHLSSDGTSERFLESDSYPNAPKQFELITLGSQNFAKLIITKFSEFVLTGTASYAASIDAVNYYTLQAAIDAATSGQTITLLQDCSDLVNISGKSLLIERGEFSFDKANITLGQNCVLNESSTLLTITYTAPSTPYYSISASSNAGGTIAPAGTIYVAIYTNATYTITPEAGFVISDVLVDGVSVGAVAAYTFYSVTVSHTIEAKFVHVCPSDKFTDVNTDLWYHEGVDFVLLNKLFIGTSETTFEPDMDMTRAMLVTVLWRLENKPDSTAANPFTDVASGTWYTDAVVWAAENDIVKGYDADTFGPEDPITREQIAAVLYRYASYKGYDLTATNDLTKFTDAGAVSAWALTSVKWAVAEGLIEGVSDTCLDPVGKANRAQVATVLMRFAEKVMN